MGTEMARPKPAPRTLAEWRAEELGRLRRGRDEADRIIRERTMQVEQLTGAIFILEEENRRAAEFERAESGPAEGGPAAASAQSESADDPEVGMKERAAAASAATMQRLADYSTAPPELEDKAT